MYNVLFSGKDADGEEQDEDEALEFEEEEMEGEPYFPHELTSPEPIYEYGRDLISPRTVSEISTDYSHLSSELTFSEYVQSLLIPQ